MQSDERPDLLVGSTVDEIVGVFDVHHVFPVTYAKERKRAGFWTRLKTFFGLGGGHPPEGDSESRAEHVRGDELRP